MKHIYAIKDRLSNDFVGMQMYELFVFRTDQQAIRYFADSILDKTSLLHKHPADFELVALGMLEDTTGGPVIVVGEKQHRSVITGDAIIAAQLTGGDE